MTDKEKTDKERAEREFELLKIMYENVYDELNRSRDWPIKIMAFATGVDVAIYGLLKFNGNDQLHIVVKLILGFIVFIVTRVTVKNILKQHSEYKKYRNIQRGIQKELQIQNFNVGGVAIFPPEWTNFITDLKDSDVRRFGLGYQFYVIYISSLSAIAIGLIIFQ